MPMKWLAALVVVLIVWATFFFSYELIGAGGPVAYMADRWTGTVWVIAVPGWERLRPHHY